MQKLTIEETIDRIGQLIDTGRGDPSRLDNIRESLRNNKTLFTSDKLYVEKLLDSSIDFTRKESPQHPLLPHVKKLIDSNSGDLGRLQYIYDALLHGKSLYESDHNYIQRKLNEVSNNTVNTHTDKKITINQTDIQNHPSQKITETSDMLLDALNVDKLVTNVPKLVQDTNGDIMTNESTHIESTSSELSEIKQTYPKQIRRIETEINLESEIKAERERIASEIELLKQISAQKAEIEQVKNERIAILDSIKKEQNIVINESKKEEEKLIQIQKEQKEIEKEIQQNQLRLKDMRESYKSSLDEQTKLIKQLREEEIELNDTQTQLNEVKDHIDQEKQSLESESLKQKQNLDKLRSEKDSLEKAKSDYDSILSEIDQEKQSLESESLKQKQNLDKLRSEKDSLEKAKSDYDSILSEIDQE
ncbi:MAG: hypothetical protein OEW49_06490, partial [Nitrosopumilus sp.]|nr:hypothetical protein [Nitrosopumilus sp.]